MAVLYASISVLNLMQAATRSQCREKKRGVTWALLGLLKTNRAAAYLIICKGLIVQEVQKSIAVVQPRNDKGLDKKLCILHARFVSLSPLHVCLCSFQTLSYQTDSPMSSPSLHTEKSVWSLSRDCSALKLNHPAVTSQSFHNHHNTFNRTRLVPKAKACKCSSRI